MPNQVIYIMGVSGSGKTSIGQLLAEKTGYAFYDADQFHPQSNIDKMKAGVPLSDEDRWPWLVNINNFATEKINSTSIIIACSALKQVYRNQLSKEIELQCRWIFLKGDYETILHRMEKRPGHFMPTSLLQSQFDISEAPLNAITADIKLSPDQVVEYIISKLNNMQEFGIIGLGVMGKSLSRNLAGKSYSLSLYNRYVPVTEVKIAENFIASHIELSNAIGFEDLAQFVSSLQPPRKILMMLPAGNAVDDTITLLLPHLSANDILIDAGNSFYKDTEKRTKQLKKAGILFLGIGVSGGEEGALKGPSIMAGGSKEGYDKVKNYLESIAAKDNNQNSCCAYIGDNAAGHFVKMVHNGLEYAEMQLLAEVVSILRSTGTYNPGEIALLLKDQLATNLNSYLLEITIEILQKKEGEKWLIDVILDKAGNKGTGSWATIAACELGVPIPTLTDALFARYQSEFLTERKQAAAIYAIQQQSSSIDINTLFNAYGIARIVNHHQGFHLVEAASETYLWKINLAELARIWTNGCIIRSQLMATLSNSLKNNTRILLQPEMVKEVATHFSALKNIVAFATENHIPAPCFTSAAHYLFSYTQEQSSANIIQAQRDFFGAHTYQRKDDASGKKYHTNWLTE
jgi:6-phosphogluconate dehydrogenase